MAVGDIHKATDEQLETYIIASDIEHRKAVGCRRLNMNGLCLTRLFDNTQPANDATFTNNRTGPTSFPPQSRQHMQTSLP
jgi:hypothetical protein